MLLLGEYFIVIHKKTPDQYDLLSAGICIIGVSVMLFCSGNNARR